MSPSRPWDPDARIVFPSSDGAGIPGALFHPDAGLDRQCAVVLSTATGAPQRFYFPFARDLADAGFAVLTYDFRGMGWARPARMRGFDATFTHWANDAEGALAHARQRWPSHRLMTVGHSIGGLMPMLADGVVHVERMVTVGTQTAYWRDWPLKVRYPMFFLWHVLVPLVTSVAGYFPASRLNLGEDLPKGLAQAWARRWRLEMFDGFPKNPGDRIRRVRAKVLALAPTDDTFGSPAALRRLHDQLSAPVTYRFLDPREHGYRSIGHFGYFHLRHQALWAQSKEWLGGEAGPVGE